MHIDFGQVSIKLNFNQKKIKNKQPNRSMYDKFFSLTASCEAGRVFTSKQQMKPAAVKDAKRAAMDFSMIIFAQTPS